MPTLSRLLARAAQAAVLTDPDLPLAAHLSGPAARVAVVTGANASGKSLFAQVVASVAHGLEVLPISVSIRERTGSGTSEMAAMRRAFMFGDESEQSTGATSVGTCQSGFDNLVERARQRPALLILDEPDMGLSEDYAAAMGQWIAQQALALDPAQPNLVGVLVVSHSRPLVRALRDALGGAGQPLQHVAMGQPVSLEAWLESCPSRTVDELMALPALGHDRRLKVCRVLEQARAARAPARP